MSSEDDWWGFNLLGFTALPANCGAIAEGAPKDAPKDGYVGDQSSLQNLSFLRLKGELQGHLSGSPGLSPTNGR
jgi:hypothetical protein